mgnify:CR=1 FL=1
MTTHAIAGYDLPLDLWEKKFVAHDNANSNSITNSTPPIDLRSLTYVSPTETLDHVSCPICKLPFIEPWSTICGHTFCKECIFESFKSVLGERCPLDRVHLRVPKSIRRQLRLRKNSHNRTSSDSIVNLGEGGEDNGEDNDEERDSIDAFGDEENDIDIYPAPIIVSNMTDDLEVFCLNKSRGCTWTGERWSIKKHLDDTCEFTRILCICGEFCERKTLVENRLLTQSPSGLFILSLKDVPVDRRNNIATIEESDAYGGTFSEDDAESNPDIDADGIPICPHTCIPCADCAQKVRLMDITFHLENECLKHITTCTGCHLSFPLMHLKLHQKHCQKIYVDCPGLQYGCTWKGQRELLTEIHENDCVFIKMSGYFKKLEGNMQELNKENDSLRLQMSSILNSIVNGKVHNLGYPLELEEVGVMHDSGNSNLQHGTNIHGGTLHDMGENIGANFSFPAETQRMSMSKVKTLIRELEINKNVTKALVDENVNLREQMNSQRAMLLSLQQQMQFMMIERRRMFIGKNSSSSTSLGVEAKLTTKL